jgi:hypothetical protein
MDLFVSRFEIGLLTLFLVFLRQKPGGMNKEKAKGSGESPPKDAT